MMLLLVSCMCKTNIGLEKCCSARIAHFLQETYSNWYQNTVTKNFYSLMFNFNYA